MQMDNNETGQEITYLINCFDHKSSPFPYNSPIIFVLVLFFRPLGSSYTMLGDRFVRYSREKLSIQMYRTGRARRSHMLSEIIRKYIKK